MIDVIPLTAEQTQLVTLADEAARAKLEAAEARHKAAYLEEMRAIQAAFEAIVQPVLDGVAMGPADTARLMHDDNGVLCVEVVRRSGRPTLAEVDALADAVGAS
jgi:hypothetical protein